MFDNLLICVPVFCVVLLIFFGGIVAIAMRYGKKYIPEDHVSLNQMKRRATLMANYNAIVRLIKKYDIYDQNLLQATISAHLRTIFPLIPDNVRYIKINGVLYSFDGRENGVTWDIFDLQAYVENELGNNAR